MNKKALDRESDQREPGIKGFFHWWLENENNKKNFYVDILINLIIFASIYFVYLEFSYGDNITENIIKINDIFLIFFITEYILRFYVSTDFLADAFNKPDGSLLNAITNKINWMVKFFSIIDLLSILPAVRYLRVFRTLRILRLLRLLRFLRVLKIFRNFEKYLLVFRGLTENWRVFSAFVIGIVFLVGVLSFGIYLFEMQVKSENFDTYNEVFWHSLNIIGLFEDSPKTLGGKAFSSLVTLSNIFFIGIIISFMTVKMEAAMHKVKTGDLGKIKLKGHIVICGYTWSARIVIDDVLKEKHDKKIVLVTLQDDPNINGVIYFHGDFADEETLKKVNLGKACKCIIFAEPRSNEDKRTTDMRTVMTVFNAKSQYPRVHTISEINYEANAHIIKDKMNGDELIYKEKIDANLINSCINISYISPLIYEILNSDGKKLQEKKLEQLGVAAGSKMQEAKENSIKENITILGLLRDHKPVLAPENEMILQAKDKVIVLG